MHNEPSMRNPPSRTEIVDGPKAGDKRRRESSIATPISNKAQKAKHGSILAALDRAHPETWPRINIPAYDKSQPLIPLSSMEKNTTPTSLPELPRIKDSALAEAPFIHSSTVNSKYSSETSLTYERLEFLGDAYLEVIATRIIFSRFPSLYVGKQAQIREQMVKNSTLAGFARAYGFEERIKAGQNEKGKEKIAADVFEAYVGALVLDPEAGFATVETWLTKLWLEILMRQEKRPIVSDLKTELNKQVMIKGVKLEYRRISFDERSQAFEVEIHLTGWDSDDGCIGRAVGKGKTDAGMQAARNVLENQPLMAKLRAKKRRRDDERKAATQAIADVEAQERIIIP